MDDSDSVYESSASRVVSFPDGTIREIAQTSLLNAEFVASAEKQYQLMSSCRRIDPYQIDAQWHKKERFQMFVWLLPSQYQPVLREITTTSYARVKSGNGQ
jgi:hypothetical protein